jgi:PAS domain S-box-containing protein
MIQEFLQDRASLYVSGAMVASEREEFELLVECHEELGKLVADLTSISAAVVLSTQRANPDGPSPVLKHRVMETLKKRAQQKAPAAFVRTDSEGLVQWVNPAFTEMCGYTLDELRGKKLGPILQGEMTDRVAVERMRRAVHAYRPCRETIVNYHKSGRPYWVEIAIEPVFDDAGRPVYLLARENELADRYA